MKTEKMKRIKKVISAMALSAVVAVFASMGVSAVEEFIVGTYTGFNPYQNATFEAAYMKGYYEATSSNGHARAGTHTLATGNFQKKSYVIFYYINKEGKSSNTKHLGAVRGSNGWVCSNWVKVPDDCLLLTKIEFCSDTYTGSSSNVSYTDKIIVTV